jgi:hypothetical protein
MVESNFAVSTAGRCSTTITEVRNRMREVLTARWAMAASCSWRARRAIPWELAGFGIRIPRMDIEWLDDVVAERDVVEADRAAPDGHARECVRRCNAPLRGRLNPICIRSFGLGHASR